MNGPSCIHPFDQDYVYAFVDPFGPRLIRTAQIADGGAVSQLGVLPTSRRCI